MTALIPILVLLYGGFRFSKTRGGKRLNLPVAKSRIATFAVLALLPALYPVANGGTNLFALIGLAGGILLAYTLYYELAHPLDPDAPTDETNEPDEHVEEAP